MQKYACVTFIDTNKCNMKGIVNISTFTFYKDCLLDDIYSTAVMLAFALESWPKGRNAFYIQSPVMDQTDEARPSVSDLCFLHCSDTAGWTSCT